MHKKNFSLKQPLAKNLPQKREKKYLLLKRNLQHMRIDCQASACPKRIKAWIRLCAVRNWSDVPDTTTKPLVALSFGSWITKFAPKI